MNNPLAINTLGQLVPPGTGGGTETIAVSSLLTHFEQRTLHTAAKQGTPKVTIKSQVLLTSNNGASARAFFRN